MATQYYGSIDFDKLVEAIKTGKMKTHRTDSGKRYVNIGVWINDTPDQYGNHGSISLTKKKEFKDDPNVYIANIRLQQPKEMNTAGIEEESDDLPF